MFRHLLFFCAGFMFLQLGHFSQSVAYGESNFSKGEQLFLENKPEEAIVYLKKAYSSKEDSKVYEYLSLSYFQLGMYDEGIAIVNAGMKVSGTDKKLLAFNAGNAAFIQGKYEAADAWFTTAIMADATYSSPVLNRANTRIYENKITDAKADYRKFLELEPDDYRRPEIEEILKEIDAEIALEEQREAERKAEEQRIREEEERLAEAQRKAEEERQAAFEREMAAQEAERQRLAAEEAERKRKLLEEVAASLQDAENAYMSVGAEETIVYGYETALE